MTLALSLISGALNPPLLLIPSLKISKVFLLSLSITPPPFPSSSSSSPPPSSSRTFFELLSIRWRRGCIHLKEWLCIWFFCCWNCRCCCVAPPGTQLGALGTLSGTSGRWELDCAAGSAWELRGLGRERRELSGTPGTATGERDCMRDWERARGTQSELGARWEHRWEQFFPNFLPDCFLFPSSFEFGEVLQVNS